MSDLRALRELGEQFERLAGTTPPRRGRPVGRRRALVLALLGALLAAAGAVAASGLLTGEPVRNPKGVTFSPTRGLGTPVAGSVRLLDLRVADPAGGLPWGMRTLRTTRGLVCVQVGRVFEGRLGVLGRDGAFANDGRFHEIPPDVLARADCQQTDGAGNGFLAVSYQGLPASGLGGGCRAPGQPEPPPRPSGLPRPPQPPTCPAADERILYYGLLGPQGESVTYRGAGGRVVTAPTSGPDSGYLVVLRPGAEHRLRGQFTFALSPGSGLRSVQYRDGSVCRLRSPRALGGARPCPLVGYVAPNVPRVSAAQVATPVRARFAPRPVLAPGADAVPKAIRRSWKLTVTFRARVPSDAKSYYVITVGLDRGRACRGTLIGPVARDLAAGDLVRESFWIPTRCHGTVRGQVSFHQPSRGQREQLPFGAVAGDGPRVGGFAARIPR
jgi:hypothetical protein